MKTLQFIKKRHVEMDCVWCFEVLVPLPLLSLRYSHALLIDSDLT